MLIIKNAEGGGTNLINSGISYNNDNPPIASAQGNIDIDLSDLLNNDSFPVGTIMMFNGDLTKLGDGWYVCDGKNGTPNLLGKFIRCISTPNDSKPIGIDNLTGGYTDKSVPAHDHTATVVSSGEHTHQTTKTSKDSKYAGSHTHKAPNQPQYGSREVCSTCGPTSATGPGHYPIFEDIKKRDLNWTGTHQHKAHFPSKTSTSDGAHEHNFKILNQKGTVTSDGNLPKHVEIIHIMKVR